MFSYWNPANQTQRQIQYQRHDKWHHDTITAEKGNQDWWYQGGAEQYQQDTEYLEDDLAEHDLFRGPLKEGRGHLEQFFYVRNSALVDHENNDMIALFDHGLIVKANQLVIPHDRADGGARRQLDLR